MTGENFFFFLERCITCSINWCEQFTDPVATGRTALWLAAAAPCAASLAPASWTRGWTSALPSDKEKDQKQNTSELTLNLVTCTADRWRSKQLWHGPISVTAESSCLHETFRKWRFRFVVRWLCCWPLIVPSVRTTQKPTERRHSHQFICCSFYFL